MKDDQIKTLTSQDVGWKCAVGEAGSQEIARIRGTLAENETRDVCAVHAVALPDNAELTGLAPGKDNK